MGPDNSGFLSLNDESKGLEVPLYIKESLKGALDRTKEIAVIAISTTES